MVTSDATPRSRTAAARAARARLIAEGKIGRKDVQVFAVRDTTDARVFRWEIRRLSIEVLRRSDQTFASAAEALRAGKRAHREKFEK